MGTDEDFKNAAKMVRDGKVKTKDVSDEQKLEMYALYKQATEGDCKTDKPGMLDFKEKAKWKAWKELEGMSERDAKKKYIRRVEKLNDC